MAIAIDSDRFGFVRETNDEFLSLFPHRHDYIYAAHPNPHERPQWKTESQHPLSDRLFQQGSFLYGVRFGSQTSYCLLDIDIGSAYHPSQDPFAISRILEALEPLGFVSYVACTSSYSQGLHLYFPFEVEQVSWKLAAAITTILESRGLKCHPGQLEVFPNNRLYVLDGKSALFNAHRLPLQAGSYLLNSSFEPVSSTQEEFVRQWQSCSQRNTVEACAIEQTLKQLRRKHHRISQNADKFLNDLNAEIEVGWTDRGQTNYLLGRIAMRCYIFHHVKHGGEPLVGRALTNEIVSVATSLPGYQDWCGHQHEIDKRAEEWARCIENSHYFPYGTRQGKYKERRHSSDGASEDGSSISWNQQKAQAAQEKIQQVVAALYEQGELPETATKRFKTLLTYGIGGSTLYKYKSTWHPDLWKPPLTPPTLEAGGELATASPANSPNPTSLLSGDDRNPLSGNALNPGDGSTVDGEVRNSRQTAAWQQVLIDLKRRRDHQKREQMARQQARLNAISQQDALIQRQKMQDYLISYDPVLMKEGLQWFLQQDEVLLWQLLPEKLGHQSQPVTDSRTETLIQVFQALLSLDWSPANIRQSLKVQFGQTAIASLSFEELCCWMSHLQEQVNKGSRIPGNYPC